VPAEGARREPPTAALRTTAAGPTRCATSECSAQPRRAASRSGVLAHTAEAAAQSIDRMSNAPTTPVAAPRLATILSRPSHAEGR
jgi:hypothetical protein